MDITPLEKWTSSKLRTAGPLTISLLQRYQLGRLRETLKQVLSHSRFYREHLRGVDPASVQNMEDVARLPFTQPIELAARSDDFLCVSPRDVSRIVTLHTSGTTGGPKRIAFTPEDQELTIDFFHHGMTTLIKPSARVIIFLPGETEGSVGDLLKKGLFRFGCEGIVFGPIDDYGCALKAIFDLRPSCAVGIPSQLLALSRYAKSGASHRQIQIESVLLSTDYVPQAVVDSLTRSWGCKVFGHYGMTEMGLGGAVECFARDGYHMRDADLLFEIINPVTGGPVANGEYGEVVFSTLTRQGMPLIRYRTGDRSRFLTQPCPCGSVLRRMERISGRLSASVRLPDGLFISIMQLDEIVFCDPRVLSYKAEICLKDGCDCLVLTIHSAQAAVDPERMASELCRSLSIGDLIAQKRLKLEVREGEVGYFTTGTTKRFIADRRP
jgi:phenylacetate-coenzyme A ligase PaaK-like adenylate-forming protein